MCFATASFGDVQAGPMASLAIEDCAEQLKQPSVAGMVKRQIYMDDICIAVQHGEDLDAMIQEVDSGLKQGSFIIKKWVKTGDSLDDCVQYLSYDYLPEKDKFKVRIKMNYSKKKRGIRVQEDFKDIHQLAESVLHNGITKRNLASLIMGPWHDPTGMVIRMGTT